MLEYLENTSHKALELIDSRASSFWSMFCQSMEKVLNFEKLHNEIVGAWRQADYISRMNQTYQDTIEAFGQFTAWSQQICDLQNFNIRNQFECAFAVVMFIVVISIATFTARLSKDRDEKNQKGASSPAKVLSIFELAKTAYIDGHGEDVMNLVDKLKFDVNFPIPTTGMSLFLCACISGKRKLVEFLLQKGGDTSAVNSDGDSCLYLATFATGNNSSSSLIELLIKHGCKVNGQNYRGNTALHLAASRGNIRLVQTLLTHGADPVRGNNVGISPLDSASHAGHMEIAEMLEKYTCI